MLNVKRDHLHCVALILEGLCSTRGCEEIGCRYARMRKIKRPTLIYSWLACIQVRRRRFTLTYRGDRRCSVVAHAGLLGGEADGSVLNAMPGDGGELLRKGETTIVVHGD